MTAALLVALLTALLAAGPIASPVAADAAVSTEARATAFTPHAASTAAESTETRATALTPLAASTAAVSTEARATAFTSHAASAAVSAGPGTRPPGVARALAGPRRTAFADEPTVENRQCPLAVPAGTTCGFLLVPERRDVPNSRTIKVAFAVHKSSAPGHRPDPVVYSSGGPGSASLQLVEFLAHMLPDRDVVVVDQRGGRHSEPRLSCPEIVRGVVETLKTPGPTAQETGPLVREALACQSRLEAEHVDLRGYQTAEIAADVVDLRRALGYRQWNLFGVSYSTRSMLLAASEDPQGTRSVVLDSFLPASAKWYDEAGQALASAVAKLGLTARFNAMVARFNAHPETYETQDPLTRKRIAVQLNGDDVATILEEALHEADVIPVMPALVDGLADGRADLLQPLVDQAGDGLTSHEWGLYYAVQCQDEVPFNRFPDGEHPRLFTAVLDAAVCGAWKLPAARDESTVLPDATAPVGSVPGPDDTTAASDAGAGSGSPAAAADPTGTSDAARAAGTTADSGRIT
ncbi:alpha/beta fold hydrolase, partial [Microbispora sp. ATCC PTA-5024]|uniref:alpha/beta fold hydrolase n=1 Tax=Microbispora sp. ATCC PTA-5024 TaxID=316330 RepID=UPI0003DCB296